MRWSADGLDWRLVLPSGEYNDFPGREGPVRTPLGDVDQLRVGPERPDPWPAPTNREWKTPRVADAELDSPVDDLRRDVRLADGTDVRLRPVRPNDQAALVEAFGRLSPESRLLRFFTPMSRLSPRQLQYLTHIDYVDHFAWAAFDRARVDEPGSTPDGLGIGVARYIRLDDEPDVAELAVAVVDDYQGRGLGTLLVEALVTVARERGIRRFCAFVRNENAPMLSVLHRFGASEVRDEPGVTRVDIPIEGDSDQEAGAEVRRALGLSVSGSWRRSASGSEDAGSTGP